MFLSHCLIKHAKYSIAFLAMVITIKEEDKLKFRDLSMFNESNLMDYLAKCLLVFATFFKLRRLVELEEISTTYLSSRGHNDDIGHVAYLHLECKAMKEADLVEKSLSIMRMVS